MKHYATATTPATTSVSIAHLACGLDALTVVVNTKVVTVSVRLRRPLTPLNIRD